MSNRPYLPGLTSLRFFAAAIVVLDHANYNLEKFSLPHNGLLLFNRGFEAVTFFFVLSGFLITFLLLHEYHSTSTISITRFYEKRIKRIWPLYFLVIFLGLCLYNILFPIAGIEYSSNYNIGTVLALFFLFLSNLAYSAFSMGGVLAVTWSIGIEEQFYLVWAPLVKKYIQKLLGLLWVIYIFWVAVQVINDLHLFDFGNTMQKFIGTMQFNCMALGGIGAYHAFYNRERLLNFWIFNSKAGQWVTLLLLIVIFIIWDFGIPHFLVMQLLPLLFLWLIIDTALNAQPLLKLETPGLLKLGTVSYGIYMLHYMFIYLFTFISARWALDSVLGTYMFYPLYFLAVIGATILISIISFRYLEIPFLNMKINLYRVRALGSIRIKKFRTVLSGTPGDL